MLPVLPMPVWRSSLQPANLSAIPLCKCTNTCLLIQLKWRCSFVLWSEWRHITESSAVDMMITGQTFMLEKATGPSNNSWQLWLCKQLERQGALCGTALQSGPMAQVGLEGMQHCWTSASYIWIKAAATVNVVYKEFLCVCMRVLACTACIHLCVHLCVCIRIFVLYKHVHSVHAHHRDQFEGRHREPAAFASR